MCAVEGCPSAPSVFVEGVGFCRFHGREAVKLSEAPPKKRKATKKKAKKAPKAAADGAGDGSSASGEG